MQKLRQMGLWLIMMIMVLGAVACSAADETEGGSTQDNNNPEEQQQEADSSSDDENKDEEDSEPVEAEQPDSEDSQSSGEQQQTVEGLSVEEVKAIMITFNQRLFVERDENQRVKDFQTKQELNQYIEEVATTEIASGFVNQFYEERDEGLYFLPQGMPPMFDPEKPFELEQVSESTDLYLLLQPNSTEIHGEYILNVLLEKENNQYKIKEYSIKRS
ncbi:MAG: hypothetical protein H0Z32_09815 [Bacillaceae bacterium]|nr:hypothetical protein [Bacillaceae bacterium]